MSAPALVDPDVKVAAVSPPIAPLAPWEAGSSVMLDGDAYILGAQGFLEAKGLGKDRFGRLRRCCNQALWLYRRRQRMCATWWPACCPRCMSLAPACACWGRTTGAPLTPWPQWQLCSAQRSWSGQSCQVRSSMTAACLQELLLVLPCDDVAASNSSRAHEQHAIVRQYALFWHAKSPYGELYSALQASCTGELHVWS